MTIDKNISVHLQDFPDVSFLKEESELVADMDIVREVCSAALSIRDQKALRVRLPLHSLTVIGKNTARILPYSEIIADEVNVKKVAVEEGIGEFAELMPVIDVKKLGPKVGPKLKEILADLKLGKWQLAEPKLKIAGLELAADEFSMKLVLKEKALSDPRFAFATTAQHLLVKLDTSIDLELAQEGSARDMIRLIQQARKNSKLDVADRIGLAIFTSNLDLISSINKFENYIKEQTLCNTIEFLANPNEVKAQTKFYFEEEMEEVKLVFGISKL